MVMKLTSAEIQSLCLSIEGLTEPGELALLYQLCFQAPVDGWFVELGSYQGRSSVAICQGALECGQSVMLIDNFSNIVKRGWDDKHGTVAQLRCNLAAFGYEPVIIDGDSRDVPEVLRSGASVAYLFIDSNHEPAHFEAEWNIWKGYLLPGSVIACHDYANPNCAGLGPMIDKYLGHLSKVALVGTIGAWKWGG
jgi:hypothetical protein